MVIDQSFRSGLELIIDLLYFGMLLILPDSNRSGIKPGALQSVVLACKALSLLPKSINRASKVAVWVGF